MPDAFVAQQTSKYAIRIFAAVLCAALIAFNGVKTPLNESFPFKMSSAFALETQIPAMHETHTAAELIQFREAAGIVSGDTDATYEGVVSVSAEVDAASIEGAAFALNDFSRAQIGSSRLIEGIYHGYTYYQGGTSERLVALATSQFNLVYVPQSFVALCDISQPDVQEQLKAALQSLDEASNNGGIVFNSQLPWYFTSESVVQIGGVEFAFAQELKKGAFYTCVRSPTGEDVVDAGLIEITHANFASLVPASDVQIAAVSTGWAAFQDFLKQVDLSPLWVTLKTTGAAIIFIFILGLAAAYFSLRLPKRTQDIADTIFTIPMVLPPTVCGFLLLWVLGNNTELGRWLASMNIHLTFSWEATVIAAVVVAFPLMYRSARGAFENIDPTMLDAARTLGWSNLRVFFKLMLPLSWSSIAAGTVLAFARALGEFGATLFLAGNYAGVTRTIPIAIYFEWMSGNADVALFWTIVIILFSFVVVLFINLWSRRTTKYRRPIQAKSLIFSLEPKGEHQ